MNIKKLIMVYERLLPIYELSYKLKHDPITMRYYGVHSGLCASSWDICGVQLSEVMNKDKGYYKNYLNYRHGTAFLDVSNWYLFKPNESWKDLKPRIDFMKSEIKSLKRLIKKGYKHV